MKTQMKFIYIIEEIMNTYLYASNLAHITRQIAWNAAKRGVAAPESRAPIRRKSAACVIM
jgi:hypothetical protein